MRYVIAVAIGLAAGSAIAMAADPSNPADGKGGSSMKSGATDTPPADHAHGKHAKDAGSEAGGTSTGDAGAKALTKPATSDPAKK